jgi:hypothetical protein
LVNASFTDVKGRGVEQYTNLKLVSGPALFQLKTVANVPAGMIADEGIVTVLA